MASLCGAFFTINCAAERGQMGFLQNMIVKRILLKCGENENLQKCKYLL